MGPRTKSRDRVDNLVRRQNAYLAKHPKLKIAFYLLVSSLTIALAVFLYTHPDFFDSVGTGTSRKGYYTLNKVGARRWGIFLGSVGVVALCGWAIQLKRYLFPGNKNEEVNQNQVKR